MKLFWRKPVAPGREKGESIKKKLSLGLFALFALILLVGSVGIQQLETVASSTQELRDQTLPRNKLVKDIERGLAEHAILSRRRVETTDFRQVAAIQQSMREIEKTFETNLQALRGSFGSEGQKALIDEARTNWTVYLASVQDVLRLSEQGALSRAQARFAGQTQTALDLTERTLSDLSQIALVETDRLTSRVEAQYQQARVLTSFVLSLGLCAILGARIWIGRQVSDPLLQISASMKALTTGADDVVIPRFAGRTDEIGTLAEAAIAFREALVATRKLARDVERERAWLAATVENMPIGMGIFDAGDHLLLSNATLVRTFDLRDGDTRAGTHGQTLLERIMQQRDAPEPAHSARTLLQSLRDGTATNGIWDLVDGRSIEVILQTVPDGWIFICEDVTERTQAERRIYRMARTDSLTGLANRLGFQERLANALAQPDISLAVILIDLDRFKHINDTLGHPVGDKLLKKVSERLNWAIGDHDLVARLGGDEFAVINLTSEGKDATTYAQKIVGQLAKPFDIDGHVVQIGGSAGISLAPIHGTVAADLLRNADLALYEAKDNGRGNWQVFDPEMNQKQQALHDLEQSLRKATSAEEFQVHFQPLIDLDHEMIVGAEALVRWNHPTRGLVPPNEFVPMAEELGMIADIGRIVLSKACMAASRWPDTIKVAINLSPLQFQTTDIVADIKTALAQSGLDPRRLELEITESVFIANTERTLDTLSGLRDIGVSVALDDFGTGYSSLQYLQSFPFDRVKIDASFVRGVPYEEGAVAIVQAICSLAGNFGMAITAEGIETETQLAFVQSANVPIGQGFLFSPAIPEDQFARLVETGARSPRQTDWRKQRA